MLKFENKEFRNLQEQVLKNAVDIQNILQGNNVLNQFGIKVIGQINTPAELPPVSTFQGEYGDAYAVGTSAPYSLYIWTRNIDNNSDGWFNIGLFPQAGPQGPQGTIGETGPQGERGNSVFTYNEDAPSSLMTLEQMTNVGWKSGDTYINALSGDVWVLQYNVSMAGYNWMLRGNIRGPQGVQGIQGPKGDTGAIGPQGPQGPQGDPGDIIKIVDILKSTNELPAPTTVSHTTGYLVGTAAPYHLYIIVGETQQTQKWFDTGAFGDFELVNITVPLETTQGTLTNDQLSILKNSPYNMINLNGEYFRLNDDKTDDGYLIYSHIGSNNIENNAISKIIRITISTLRWVLTEERLATYEDAVGNKKSLILTDSNKTDSVSYDTTVSDVELVFNSSDFYSYSSEDETGKRKFVVELLNPSSGGGDVEEILQFKMTSVDFYQYKSDKSLVKQIPDISADINDGSWQLFYNYIRENLMGMTSSTLDCGAKIGFFLSQSGMVSEVPPKFKTYITTSGVVPSNIDSMKIECVGASQSAAECIINMTVWTRDAREFELVMFNGIQGVVASDWQEKASKAYVDGLISNVNTSLDTKAAITYVDGLISNVNTTLETKTSKEYVDGLISNVNTTLDTKASIEYVDGLVGNINSVLDSINGEVL